MCCETRLRRNRYNGAERLKSNPHLKWGSVTYDIKKRIAVLSESGNGAFATEVNLISFNGAEPKLDIRKWDKRTDKMLKGIALNGEEVEALKEALLHVEDE